MYYMIADEVKNMKEVQLIRSPSLGPDAYLLSIRGEGTLSLAGTMHDLGAFATELNKTVMAKMDEEIKRIEKEIENDKAPA